MTLITARNRQSNDLSLDDPKTTPPNSRVEILIPEARDALRLAKQGLAALRAVGGKKILEAARLRVGTRVRRTPIYIYIYIYIYMYVYIYIYAYYLFDPRDTEYLIPCAPSNNMYLNFRGRMPAPAASESPQSDAQGFIANTFASSKVGTASPKVQGQ